MRAPEGGGNQSEQKTAATLDDRVAAIDIRNLQQGRGNNSQVAVKSVLKVLGEKSSLAVLLLSADMSGERKRMAVLVLAALVRGRCG